MARRTRRHPNYDIAGLTVVEHADANGPKGNFGTIGAVVHFTYVLPADVPEMTRDISNNIQTRAGFHPQGYGAFEHRWNPKTRIARWCCWGNCD